METQEFKAEVIHKLTEIESLILDFVYPTTRAKEPVSDSTRVEIPSPTILTKEQIYKDVIAFAKDVHKYSIDKKQLANILKKYTDESISSIPFNKLESFVIEISSIPLDGAVIAGREVPF